MRKFLVISMIAATLTALARVEWVSTTYDFGSFREEAGPQSGRVWLINRGQEPTVINRVKSTCGCTVAGFTEGLIEPGDSASVWFTYNPAGRPGRFEKHIKVYTGVDNDLSTITIKGTVIGANSTLAAKYPVEQGGLRLSTDHLAFGKTTAGKSRHEYISGYNQSSDTLRLAWTQPSPSISFGVSSKRVAPGDIFTMGVYFNTREEPQDGPVDYTVKLYPQAADESVWVPVRITADVEPDTSGMSEQELRDAPSAMVYPTVVELGEVGKKAAQVRFHINNEGKTELTVNGCAYPAHAPLS